MGKRKTGTRKLTPADGARWDETTRMVEERIAYHRAKALEEEEAREQPKRG
jgi:hypothetical protein